MYPNPLVADLILSGIADRMALLRKHRVEPDSEIRHAFMRLDREMELLALAARASIDFLQARGFPRPER